MAANSAITAAETSRAPSLLGDGDRLRVSDVMVGSAGALPGWQWQGGAQLRSAVGRRLDIELR
ncbi:MAG: hypothetical protein C5B56_03620 [Proteobacteria bacterium]|nr:MAG: hypothetical protein C5B56_03620 [Pseudomonadota bacterium]